MKVEAYAFAVSRQSLRSGQQMRCMNSAAGKTDCMAERAEAAALHAVRG